MVEDTLRAGVHSLWKQFHEAISCDPLSQCVVILKCQVKFLLRRFDVTVLYCLIPSSYMFVHKRLV